MGLGPGALKSSTNEKCLLSHHVSPFLLARVEPFPRLNRGNERQSTDVQHPICLVALVNSLRQVPHLPPGQLVAGVNASQCFQLQACTTTILTLSEFTSSRKRLLDRNIFAKRTIGILGPHLLSSQTFQWRSRPSRGSNDAGDRCRSGHELQIVKQPSHGSTEPHT